MTDASAPNPDSARLQSVAHDLWQAGTDRRPDLFGSAGRRLAGRR